MERLGSADAIAAAPWLSVIIPSHCGEQWIGGALSSISAEAADGVEVLVIDGSPTSATRDIARSFSERLNLRLFERPDLASWHMKTNFGVATAAASHLCWLGVDDQWLPGRARGAHVDRRSSQCRATPCSKRNHRPSRPAGRGLALSVAKRN